MPRSYAPDNGPVKFIVDEEDSIRLIGPIEPGTGLQKEIALWLDPQGTKVTVEHSITNHNLWEIELAPWALTIVSGGGTTILPQEPYRSHDDYLLPARPMVLWHFTDLSDSRWRWGKKFVCLRSDASKDEPQKIGAGNRQGWAGYWKAGTLFMKSFPYLDDADYPDLGCNCETYTAGSFMEIETLGPLARLTPGESAVHVEEWRLFDNIDIGASEDTLEAALADALSAIA
jgi:hypothetical protein